MKVLHVNTWTSGGAAKACLRIHEGLRSIGVDSSVLVKSKGNSRGEHVREVWDALNAMQKTLQLTREKQLELKQKKALKAIPEQQELYSFPQSVWDITLHPSYQEADIIHLHWVAGLLDVSSFFRKNNKPVVWTLHDFAPFSGGFHYPAGINELSVLSESQLHLEVKREAYQKSNLQVVAPSEFLSSVASGSELLRSHAHHSITNPSNVKTFSAFTQAEARKELGITSDHKMVLFVADRLDYPRKGFDLLLEAMKTEVLGDVIFAAVGDLAALKLTNPQLRSIGPVEDEATLAMWYAAADVFVIPSRIDNYPNTIGESLCAGTPVVGFRTGGIPEMVDKSNGVLTAELSVNALADSIHTALGHSWDRAAIKAAAMEKFDQQKAAKSYLRLYSGLG